jgi:hypothetical protein
MYFTHVWTQQKQLAAPFWPQASPTLRVQLYVCAVMCGSMGNSERKGATLLDAKFGMQLLRWEIT